MRGGVCAQSRDEVTHRATRRMWFVLGPPHPRQSAGGSTSQHRLLLPSLRMITLILLSVVVVLVVYLLKISHEKLQTWEKRGIKHAKPVLLFGNSLPTILGRENFFEATAKLCKKYPNEPLLGVYFFSNPILVVQDLEYIEKLLTKDFNHFPERGLELNEEKNPLDAQLFFMPGTNRWRAIRYKMTPLFTSGKMRSMFVSIQDCGKNLYTHLEKVNLTGINLKDTTNLLFIDIAGSAVFGFDANVLENPDSEFRQMTKKVFDFGLRDNIIGFVMNTMPGLARRLGLSFNKPEVVKYFVGIISEAFAQRQASGVQRNDFIQLIMQLKEKGSVEVAHWDSNDDYLLADQAAAKVTETVELTDSLLMSQAYQFLIAGIDMLALIAMYASFDLSQHPDIQEEVREEIKTQLKKHSELTYDALKDMTYLENVIKESQRLHPSALLLMRKCTKDYTFENGYKMEKGEMLIIPLTAVHSNPDHFPEPELFKPDRFQGTGRVPAFLPFGDGPRMCIAMRFAMLQAKYCMCTILMKYRIRLNPKTVLPMVLKPSAGFLIPKDDLFFDLEKLESPLI